LGYDFSQNLSIFVSCLQCFGLDAGSAVAHRTNTCFQAMLVSGSTPRKRLNGACLAKS
jgi:hypothetical protein